MAEEEFQSEYRSLNSESMDPKSIAKSYLEFVNSGGRPALASPWEEVQSALDDDPPRAWRIILWAVAFSRDEMDRSSIGTGPLEYLLVHRSEYLDRALQLALRHPKFFDALRSADIRGGAAVDVARVDAFFESIDHDDSAPT